MISLALSTSFGKLSCAVFSGEETLFSVAGQSLYGADVAGMLRSAVAEAGIQLPEVDRFLLDLGPGGTSSVRTGVAFTNALSYSLDIPVYPVTSAEAMCHQVLRDDSPDGAVIGLANSLGDSFYFGTYTDDKFEVKLGTIKDLQDIAEERRSLTFCGDANVIKQLREQAENFTIPVRVSTVSSVDPVMMLSLIEARDVQPVKFPQLPIPMAETLG